jgi:pyruvate dehydrogenase (quinone)
MGAAVPYAIAAKFAHPDRPVVALVGDGAMQMNNMAELITVAKYWREWSYPHWVVCVFNNQDLNQVTWGAARVEGDPKFEATQQIPDVPYHRFAELIGLRGIFVDTPQQMGPAWEEALVARVSETAAASMPGLQGPATGRPKSSRLITSQFDNAVSSISNTAASLLTDSVRL